MSHQDLIRDLEALAKTPKSISKFPEALLSSEKLIKNALGASHGVSTIARLFRKHGVDVSDYLLRRFITVHMKMDLDRKGARKGSGVLGSKRVADGKKFSSSSGESFRVSSEDEVL